MAIETTFVLVKPDGTARNLVPDVKGLLQQRGFRIIQEKTEIPTRDMVRDHLNWGPECRQILGARVEKLCRDNTIVIADTFMAGMTTEEIGQTFIDFIVAYNVMGPCHAMLVQGENAIEAINTFCGPTMPEDAGPDTIRGQLGNDSFRACVAERRAPYNVVHSADSPREAYEQISIWFPDYALDVKEKETLGVKVYNT